MINLQKLIGYKLLGLDSEIGKIKDFYFDDLHWTIRYLVADTGPWLIEKKVLISPLAVNNIFENSKEIAVDMTKNQIENSPSIEINQPFSRQFEESYHDYYGYPPYWGGPFSWGVYPYIVRDQEGWKKEELNTEKWDPNLRSTHEVINYHLKATDGDIGHVDDFIIDFDTWTIRYLIVKTKNWWPGKKVLVSPHWIDHVSWSNKKVYVNISRRAIQESAEYSEDLTLTPTYQASLHKTISQHSEGKF